MVPRRAIVVGVLLMSCNDPWNTGACLLVKQRGQCSSCRKPGPRALSPRHTRRARHANESTSARVVIPYIERRSVLHAVWHVVYDSERQTSQLLHVLASVRSARTRAPDLRHQEQRRQTTDRARGITAFTCPWLFVTEKYPAAAASDCA
ncbi:hypothetical protein FKP32DRAFT_848046 [Trametes sanguinea]|nr:hypothetical protein FKP32DRAFT_848046 [Trametes sanguinea]